MANPTFRDLWNVHPTNRSNQLPCRRETGVPSYANQCAIRLGECLRRAGVPPRAISGGPTCGVHPRETMHFIRAQAFADGLARANLPWLGDTEKLTGEKPAQFARELFGRKGIIFLKDYWARSGERGTGRATGDHIDLFNGYRTTASWLMEYFSWLGYYGGYAGSKEIWFWEVE
ncbi:MAG: type VI secretion system amidase effector protein Tae4 [Pseudomonadota bacterium]